MIGHDIIFKISEVGISRYLVIRVVFGGNRHILCHLSDSAFVRSNIHISPILCFDVWYVIAIVSND